MLRFTRQDLVPALLLSFCLLTAPAVGQAPSSMPVAPGGPNLQVMLEKGLRARRPVEFQFIAVVLQNVDNGTLPQPIVEQCFLRRGKRPYPFPYFWQSLKVQAQKLGVDLSVAPSSPTGASPLGSGSGS